jgi:hypothetical protein
MYWIRKKDTYHPRKYKYSINPKIRKCTGFCNHWRITTEISWTGTSWFAIIEAHISHRNGKDIFTNHRSGIRIKKHNENWRNAKRFCEFIIDNMPDYVEHISENI